MESVHTFSQSRRWSLCLQLCRRYRWAYWRVAARVAKYRALIQLCPRDVAHSESVSRDGYLHAFDHQLDGDGTLGHQFSAAMGHAA
eukprot:37726-Eustigmatos_ZCMA.PRE.1